MPDKRPDAKQSPVSAETQAIWAAAEKRFQDRAAVEEYLESTGKYSKGELAKMKLDELQSELRDEAERALQANDSRVSPETIKTWIDAGGQFQDRVQAQDFLVGTGRFGAGELGRMTDAELRAAVDNFANNALFGNDSAVKNEYVQGWLDAENRYRAANPGGTSTSPTGTREARTDSGGGTGTGTRGDGTGGMPGDDDPGASIPAGTTDDDDSGTAPEGSTTSPSTPTDAGAGGGGTTETEDTGGGEKSSVPDTWVPTYETVVTDPETGETLSDVQWYTDTETGKTYGVTSDGRVLDEDGNYVAPDAESGSAEDSDADEKKDDEETDDDTGGGAGFQPIDAENTHVGKVDLGAIAGHELGGTDVDPVEGGGGTNLSDFDGRVLTKGDLLGPGGGDPADPDDVLGEVSQRPIPALSKFGSDVTDPPKDDGGAPLGDPDGAPDVAPSVAASMLEDRGSFAIGAFDSPEPASSTADLGDDALGGDDGAVTGAD